MHDTLTQITAHMPCKTIQIGGQDYLRRYYVGTQRCGSDVWLHEFLTADGERHLHSHPFTARSIIMCGGYTEETPGGMLTHRADPIADVILSVLRIGQVPETAAMGRLIEAKHDWHRIASVSPHTWTMFVVEPHRLKHWFFRDADGVTVRMNASPREWWIDYGTRDGGVAMINRRE